MNLVGRFFLPWVAMETFLKAAIWDLAERKTLSLAAGLRVPGVCKRTGWGWRNHIRKAGRCHKLMHWVSGHWKMAKDPSVSVPNLFVWGYILWLLMLKHSRVLSLASVGELRLIFSRNCGQGIGGLAHLNDFFHPSLFPPPKIIRPQPEFIPILDTNLHSQMSEFTWV